MPDAGPGPTAGVVLAAGLSVRLGRPKQLLTAGGRILLAHVLEAVLRTDLKPVILVLGNMAEEIRAALASEQGLIPARMGSIKMAFNPDFALGQASSIRSGLAALPPESAAALFIMGDTAGLEPTLIEAILDRAGRPDGPGVVRPRYGGRPGGPVWWARRHFQELKNLRGDQGGRSLLSDLDPAEIAYLDFPFESRPLDIDTEADYQAWVEMFAEP